eukprot:8182026-Alexandrium_andersonii.AAC.1
MEAWSTNSRRELALMRRADASTPLPGAGFSVPRQRGGPAQTVGAAPSWRSFRRRPWSVSLTSWPASRMEAAGRARSRAGKLRSCPSPRRPSARSTKSDPSPLGRMYTVRGLPSASARPRSGSLPGSRRPRGVHEEYPAPRTSSCGWPRPTAV